MNPEEWLTLSSPEKQAESQNWDAYEREKVGFVYLSAAMLAIQSPIKIFRVEVGVYHGGEYVISAFVFPGELHSCLTFPPEFDGFRVLWLDASKSGEESSLP